MARPIANPITYGTLSGNVPMSDLDTSFGALFTTGFNDSSLGWVNYAADTGVANAYAVTLSVTPSSYTSGMCVAFTPQNINTGASTINVNALGTKTIVTPGNIALSGGEINNGETCVVVYDGTSFRLVSSCRLSIVATTAATSATVNAAGYSSVKVVYTYTSATGFTLTLNNLSYGATATAYFFNNSGSSNNFALTGTNAAGTAWVIASALTPGGSALTISGSGQGLANGASAMIIGNLDSDNRFRALWGGK